MSDVDDAVTEARQLLGSSTAPAARARRINARRIWTRSRLEVNVVCKHQVPNPKAGALSSVDVHTSPALRSWTGIRAGGHRLPS
jgi:hypothetical protein